ncbi:MAG: leucyl aminopeptidase family protein, partial [Saccharospirillum sp.]|uniref:M17 family metallopeptidase n=1 Tax=Saccharospirillum sp. TaxID=2033801 RepID=UPI0034A01BBD
MPILSDRLKAGNTGIPLTLLESREFESWTQGRPGEQVAWLRASGFTGKGLALLPGENGELAEVVLGVASLDDQWILGDLAKRLPEGDYLVQGSDELLDRAGLSWLLGTYQFDRYKSSEPVKARLVMADEQRVARLQRLAEGVALVRDLVNTPPNDMMPEHLSEAARALAGRFDATFNELVGDQLLTENYPTIHAVGRASVHAPRLLDLRWGNAEHPKVTLVGKGVCFDSGGLDIKPAAGMRYMKKDMGGAAHVLGLAQMIMSLNLPVNLRVLIPAVENAVAGNAFRPGDVLQTRKGLTVEIDNTDAEGRLVLCDALAEADTETPDMIIDFATLTGAARVALGTELPGYFTDADALARDLNAAGKKVSDPVWQLPLHTPYDDFLKSEVADLVNCAPSPFGGAITAGLYLKRFVEQTPWVHFDIMAWNQRALPGRPVGGEA